MLIGSRNDFIIAHAAAGLDRAACAAIYNYVQAIAEWEEGTGKNKGRLGALVCESSDSIIRVNVGSGYSDEQRDEYTHSKVMGKIVTVKYNARIKDKSGVESLFLPVFIELREDKDAADSSDKVK